MKITDNLITELVASFLILGRSPNLAASVSENENNYFLLILPVMRVISKLMYVKILCEVLLFIIVLAK